jgi:hypothetical protein
METTGLQRALRLTVKSQLTVAGEGVYLHALLEVVAAAAANGSRQ